MFLYLDIFITEVEYFMTVRDFGGLIIKIPSISIWIEYINQRERDRQERITLIPLICALCVTVLKLTSLTTLDNSLKLPLWSSPGYRLWPGEEGWTWGLSLHSVHTAYWLMCP